jgi:hypothetical protein
MIKVSEEDLAWLAPGIENAPHLHELGGDDHVVADVTSLPASRV